MPSPPPSRRTWFLACGLLLVAALVWPALSGRADPAGTASTAPAAGGTAAPGPGTTGTAATPSGTTPGNPTPATPARSTAVTRSAPPAPPAGTALAALASLQVKGRAPRTGYERELFGQAWSDVDRNGCDTRNDVLRRDLTAYALKAGTHGCVVLRGTLHDPYTGDTIAFVRGSSTSSRVQVDHVVALSDAWQKGAQQLPFDRRTAFANDPLNLLAVGGAVNQGKGDGDAATWLPPKRSFRCAYVARQVAVKKRYELWVTAAERDAVRRVLAACPDQPLPTAGQVPLGGGPEEASARPQTPTRTTAAAPASTAEPVAGGDGATDPRFDSCRSATAAGYGPYVSGSDPEYSWYQDRDGDGTVCE